MERFSPKVLTLIKYIYSVIVILVLFIRDFNVSVFVLQGLELFAIFCLFDFLSRKSVKAASVISFFVMFFFNAQLLLRFFANGYLSMIMLTNITLVQDISGKAAIYITNIIIMIICSLMPVVPILPIEKIDLPPRVIYVMPLVLSIGISTLVGGSNAPIYSYGHLAMDYKISNDAKKLLDEIEEQHNDSENKSSKPKVNQYLKSITEEFYKDGVESFWDEEALDEKPNIIYLFIEGLSSSVIFDERDFMSNSREYMDKSVNFINYYDHTAATYRGILGQLFSSHQFANRDNSNLVSIMDILREDGYKSTFVNSEPPVTEFADYLNKLGFDEFISEEKDYEGLLKGTMSNREVFNRIKQVIEDDAETDTPYFISTYFFGTHVNMDSNIYQYGDGNNKFLNKFYDFDVSYGDFMKWFNEAGELTDNTILVFTADHATYVDSDWNTTMPDTKREDVWIDMIPMYYYYKGVSPLTVDCKGKNSINAIPTLLDFINVGETSENYFLGKSLFDENNTDTLSSIFYSNDYKRISDTANMEFRDIVGSELDELRDKMNRYFVIKRLGPALP